MSFISQGTLSIDGTILDTLSAVPLSRPARDLSDDIARGLVTNVTHWNKWGKNNDIDSASAEVLAAFGGSFEPIKVADTLDVVSSSANDDGSPGGTGARTIRLYGLDENGATQTEDVTMNGTTAVTTTNQWIGGLNRVQVLTAGSAEGNVGTITIDDTGGTYGTQASVPAGEAYTQQMIFHVALNAKFLIKDATINCTKITGGGGSPVVTIRGWTYDLSAGIKSLIFEESLDTDVANHVSFDLVKVPFVLPGYNSFWMEVETDTNNTVANMRMDGTLYET